MVASVKGMLMCPRRGLHIAIRDHPYVQVSAWCQASESAHRCSPADSIIR